MKALTLHQPWASLVARGVKTIETRSWSTRHRGPLAIHAGSTWGTHWLEWMSPDDWRCNALDETGVHLDEDSNGSTWVRAHRRGLPLGAVLATCTLSDIVPIVAERGCTDHPDVPVFIAWSDRHQTATWLRWRRTVSPGWYCDRDLTEQHKAQVPFGDFTPGRYAWLLTDVVPLAEPLPARGRQRLWEWAA